MKRITATLLAIAFILITMQTAFGKETQSAQITNEPAYQCNTDPAVIEQICSSRVKTRKEFPTSNLSRTKSGFLDQWGYDNYMPSTGNVRALVLTIEFADDKLNDSEEKIQEYNSLENKLFAPFDPSKKLSEQSMRGFLYQSSYGRLDVTGDIMPLYTTSKTCRSCANDGNEWSDCIKEAVDFYINDPTVKLDLSNYDSNQDGIVDCLYVFHCGRTYFSPGEKMLGSEVRAIDYNNGEFKIKHFVMNFITAQVYICVHETGHLWGLHDNYTTAWGRCYLDAGLNDIMSTGYYFNAYYKWLLGWIEPKILTNENSPEETVELSPVESIDEGADGCYKAVVLVPDPSLLPFTEFFIAEYRIGGTGYDPPAWYENGTRVEFPETPGIILWHCNTELNSVRQYQYSDSYLLPVYKSGKSRDPNKQNNNIYRARDLYGINDVFSSTTRVNSDFYNNFYTGAYLKVENMVAEKATLQAGFRDPDLTPGPVLHLSQPSLKATKNTLVTYTLTITEGVGGKIIPFEELTFNYNMARFPQTGTVAKSYLPSMSETNPMRFSWDATHYTPASLGNGTAQLSFRAGFVTYNGRRSPQVTGELFYVDSVPPEIELTGDNPQRIMINTDYTELGAHITDNLDPDIESKLEIDASEVDTSIAGTYTVTYSATDHAGNSAKTNTRTVIVETPPPITAEIEYSPSTTTNGNVTATLKAAEAVTITNNGGSPTYTFSENGSFTFEFKNAAGNTGAAMAVVDWIDKTPPTATVSYSTTQPTNGNVVATITPSEPVTVTNTESDSLSYTFTQNGSFTFEFEDKAGNRGTATATVSNIDKSLPTGTIDYDVTNYTNQNVTATLTVDPSVTILNNDGSNIHVFTENGSFEFEIQNALGTKSTVAASVNWIDKEEPVITLNGEDSVELSCVEAYEEKGAVVTDDQDGKIQEKLNITSNVQEKVPGTYTVTYSATDHAGNVAQKKIRTVTVRHGLTRAPETAASCTKDGTAEHWICSECGKLFKDEQAVTETTLEELRIPQKAHTPGEAADCTHGQTCTMCGTVLVEKLGHDYKDTVVSPTCTEKGYTTHTCTRCGDSYTDSETAAKGHTPGAAADCTHDQTCTVCGTVLAEKLGHDYKDTVVSPTCTEKGYTTHTCTRCGNSYIGNETAAKGHTPGEWRVVTPATTAQEGLKRKECTVCHAVLETAVIPKEQQIIPSNPSYPSFEPDPEPEPEPTPQPPAKLPFEDVKEGAWYYEPISWAYENGLMSGITETAFSPNAATTRGMIVTILWRLEEQPKSTASMVFTDVRTNAFYYEPIRWAAEQGIIKGKSAASFAPNDPISRQEMAAILYRYAQYTGSGGIQNGTEILRFSDTGNVSNWAKEPMTWAVDKGILAGKKNGILDPKGKATRAEVTAMLMRYCEE